jgi:phosphate starvation-inducible protein PhoH
VVRHPVVARIVDAYDSFEQKQNRERLAKQQMNKKQHADQGDTH